MLAGKCKALQAQLRIAHGRVADLEKRADTDFLVGSLNRRGFGRELRRAIAYAGRYGAAAALVYFDVDDLKPINDRFGHAAGDAVLKAVARRIEDNVRQSDIVGRLGGDEFAVLLWNISSRDAVTKAAMLERTVARRPVGFRGRALAVAISAGVTMLKATDKPQMAIERADRAMYKRKRRKRRLADP